MGRVKGGGGGALKRLGYAAPSLMKEAIHSGGSLAVSGFHYFKEHLKLAFAVSRRPSRLD